MKAPQHLEAGALRPGEFFGEFGHEFDKHEMPLNVSVVSNGFARAYVASVADLRKIETPEMKACFRGVHDHLTEVMQCFQPKALNDLHAESTKWARYKQRVIDEHVDAGSGDLSLLPI